MREIWFVDGYNILGAGENKEGLSIDHARDRLADELADFSGFTNIEIVLVYDGHHVKKNKGSETVVSGVRVVYTQAEETADQYIERQCALLSHERCTVRVATGDGMEQHMILGLGALRMSAKELIQTLRQAKKQRRQMQEKTRQKGYLFHHLDGETLEALERIRVPETGKETQ